MIHMTKKLIFKLFSIFTLTYCYSRELKTNLKKNENKNTFSTLVIVINKIYYTCILPITQGKTYTINNVIRFPVIIYTQYPCIDTIRISLRLIVAGISN